MPEALSHHCLEPEMHVLVLIDQQSREARYRTMYDDGTEGKTIHELYYTNGEVQSRYIGVDPTGAAAPAAAVRQALLTFDNLIGASAAALPTEAAGLLRALGRVDTAGRIRQRKMP